MFGGGCSGCTEPVDADGRLSAGLVAGGVDPDGGDPAELVVPVDTWFAADVSDDLAGGLPSGDAVPLPVAPSPVRAYGAAARQVVGDHGGIDL